MQLVSGCQLHNGVGVPLDVSSRGTEQQLPGHAQVDNPLCRSNRWAPIFDPRWMGRSLVPTLSGALPALEIKYDVLAHPSHGCDAGVLERRSYILGRTFQGLRLRSSHTDSITSPVTRL